MATDLKADHRTVRISDVDAQTVLDVGARHAAVVDIQPVEAAVVDDNPSALVESDQQVGPGDQRMRDTHVGPQIAPDDDIVACCKGALGSLIAHCQHGRGWSAHPPNCTGIGALRGPLDTTDYRPRAKVRAAGTAVFDAGVAGNRPSMQDTERFPDDMPVADAVEQQRSADDSSPDDGASPRLDESDVPLEATVSDWQDQQETALSDDPEFDEPGR